MGEVNIDLDHPRWADYDGASTGAIRGFVDLASYWCSNLCCGSLYDRDSGFSNRAEAIFQCFELIDHGKKMNVKTACLGF